MTAEHPEYGDEDEIFVATPDDKDPVEDFVDDRAYDMKDIEGHQDTDNSAGEVV